MELKEFYKQGQSKLRLEEDKTFSYMIFTVRLFYKNELVLSQWFKYYDEGLKFFNELKNSKLF